MSQLTLESLTEGIKKGYVVKMSATLLLLMNSLCQMLDTACVSWVLLKNNFICMTKADGFRVLRMEGGVGGLTGGKRQTGTLGQTHWNRWLSPSQETRNWICWISKPRHLMRSLDQIWVWSYYTWSFTQRDVIPPWGKMGILQLRVEQWPRTHAESFKTTGCRVTQENASVLPLHAIFKPTF